MGLMLADWSIEVIRARKNKNKNKKKNLERKEVEQQTDDIDCDGCTQKSEQLSWTEQQLTSHQLEKKKIGELLQTESIEDMMVEIQKIVADANKLKEESDQCKVDEESLGNQMKERDLAHNERINSLEILMAEKERELLESSTQISEQLVGSKKEIEKLNKELEKYGNTKHVEDPKLEQEEESLKLVIDIRKLELDQLKAANNGLRLEMERLGVLDQQLQVEKQNSSEMTALIDLKNNQLHQVLDQYDEIQHQLDIETAAHLACQQELEKVQWDMENVTNYSTENSLIGSKNWKNMTNRKESGHILDVVQKDKGVAYSFNC